MENNGQGKAFPGYPHYPTSEDITKSDNNNGKQPINTDGANYSDKTDRLNDREGDTRIVSGTDADVTNEDLEILDAADHNMDRADSNNLQQAKLDSVDDDGDMLNEDELDVPGSDDDDENERIGEEDEENNYYSLGSDNHETQEERKGD